MPEEYRPLIFASGEQVPRQQTLLTLWQKRSAECVLSGSLSPANQEVEGPDQEHTLAPRLSLLCAFLLNAALIRALLTLVAEAVLSCTEEARGLPLELSRSLP